MATFTAWHGVDIRRFDLNWYYTHGWGYRFGDNEHVTINGRTYEDRYEIGAQDPYDDLVMYIGGTGFAVDGSGDLARGTIRLIGEYVYNGPDLWMVEGVSLPASKYHQALLTTSNADDLQLFSAALSGNDIFRLSPFDDWMNGFAGNDAMFGGAGKDTLYGGLQNDSLYGGTEADTLFGEDGNDTLHGNQDNDELRGGNGADLLFAGLNDDTLLGGPGADTLFGDAGDDVLFGGNGTDELRGVAETTGWTADCTATCFSAALAMTASSAGRATTR